MGAVLVLSPATLDVLMDALARYDGTLGGIPTRLVSEMSDGTMEIIEVPDSLDGTEGEDD